ncbi:hypothetical protein L1I79_37015 [Strepomyces sp. STD 3.1]|nr:hypothetical protein [Streptomyces sp. STD 3.1]
MGAGGGAALVPVEVGDECGEFGIGVEAAHAQTSGKSVVAAEAAVASRLARRASTFAVA